MDWKSINIEYTIMKFRTEKVAVKKKSSSHLQQITDIFLCDYESSV